MQLGSSRVEAEDLKVQDPVGDLYICYIMSPTIMSFQASALD